MTKETIIARMKLSVSQNRDKLFQVADSIQFQPKYAEYLTELEEIKQEWRDVTELDNYPEMPFPLPLPDWFPVESVKFTANWDENYVLERLAEQGDE